MGPPDHHTVGVWSGAKDVWTLGDLMGVTEGGAKVERLLRAGLPRYKDYNTGNTCVLNTVQRVGRQRHKNLAGHDSRIPEGDPSRTGRYRWGVLGSILFQRLHGRLKQLRLAAA